MSHVSFFTGKCRFCGETCKLIVGKDDACARCGNILNNLRNLSLAEIARIIDAAAMVPEGTYKIVNTALTERVNPLPEDSGQ